MSSTGVALRKIEQLSPHPNADRLEIAIVGGWQCIVGKEQHYVGQEIVYIPVDCVLSLELSDALNVTQYLHKQRVKATKLRGEKSFGIVANQDTLKNYNVFSDDLATELGITKYEPPVYTRTGQSAPRSTKKSWNLFDIWQYLRKGPGTLWERVKFVWRRLKEKAYKIQDVPEFRKYTDIENWRNYNNLFTEEDEIVITEKIHGTNFRAGWINGTFYVGSHNVNRREKESDLYWRAAGTHKLSLLLDEGQIIFGEIYGKSVQKMEYDLRDTSVRFFDLMVDGRYLDSEEFKAFCTEKNLRSVPYLYEGLYSAKKVVECGNGKSTMASHIREGCVIKSKTETISRIGRKILKYVNDDYLLGNYEEEIINH